MPSLKMKTKSLTGCLKENNGLQVCRNSSMISKNPLSHARVSQNAEEISVQSNQDALVYDKLYAQELGEADAKPNELHTDEKLFLKQPVRVTESATETMEPALTTCPSNIETIFSPILESMGFCNNEGSDNLCVPQFNSDDIDDSSRNSCKYQACNVSDFYISDMIFSALPSDSDNKTDTVFLPDYQFEESSLLCDLTEEYMVLPFLEDTLDTGHDHLGRPSSETNTDSDSSSLYMAIHQLRPCSQDSYINSYPDQDYEIVDPQMYIRNIPDQPDVSLSVLPTSVPNNKQSTKKITLVLDLDETLVHSKLDRCDDADFTFSVFLDMKEHTVYVKQRPHLMTFLKRVAEMFEIVVFTASLSIYAKQLLDILDPDGKIISRRAYRESCTISDGNYTKDLTILGVDLAKVAIIDNSPQVFRLQVNNGIPIKSWFNDPTDTALISLLPFLETLVDVDDVRPIIARKFSNEE
ncbi:hypothetical protein CASFOL_039342 [Castilleja foliolosa]|uniref:FCP1 homology domain-containing protein n=1 Tax=Castilleja foliolosa TaxID=1961234 RepID=A0ABD3BHQ7_9LAMI